VCLKWIFGLKILIALFPGTNDLYNQERQESASQRQRLLKRTIKHIEQPLNQQQPKRSMVSQPFLTTSTIKVADALPTIKNENLSFHPSIKKAGNIKDTIKQMGNVHIKPEFFELNDNSSFTLRRNHEPNINFPTYKISLFSNDLNRGETKPFFSGDATIEIKKGRK